MIEGFVCIGCGHELEPQFCMRAKGYCYLCDPHVTLQELLQDQTPMVSMNRFSPAVYLDAAKWLFENPNKRCGTAILNHRSNEWEPLFLDAGRVFYNWIEPTFSNRVNFGAYEEDGFQENKTDLTPEHLLERKLFALLLMYEIAKDLYAQGELI